MMRSMSWGQRSGKRGQPQWTWERGLSTLRGRFCVVTEEARPQAARRGVRSRVSEGLQKRRVGVPECTLRQISCGCVGKVCGSRAKPGGQQRGRHTVMHGGLDVAMANRGDGSPRFAWGSGASWDTGPLVLKWETPGKPGSRSS